MVEKLYMIALSPALEKGSIQRWNIKEGGQAAVGETIGIFGEGGEGIGDLLPEIENEADKSSEFAETDKKEPEIVESEQEELPADILFEKRVKISF